MVGGGRARKIVTAERFWAFGPNGGVRGRLIPFAAGDGLRRSSRPRFPAVENISRLRGPGPSRSFALDAYCALVGGDLFAKPLYAEY